MTRAYEWQTAKMLGVELAGIIFGKPVWRGNAKQMFGFYTLVQWHEQMYGKEK